MRHELELKNSGFTPRSINAYGTMTTAGDDYKETFQKAFKKMSNGGAILGFLGNRGTGKTVMSVALAKTLMDKAPSRADGSPQYSVLYTTAHQLFMRYKDTYRRGSEVTESQVHDYFQAPKLLVIDEIGRRQESDWENRTLIDLGDARYGAMKDTILISNQEKQVFDEAIGDSLVSRMTEGGGCLLFNWPSFRG